MQPEHGCRVCFALQNFHAQAIYGVPTTKEQKMSAIKKLLTSALTIIGFNSLIGYIAYVGALT